MRKTRAQKGITLIALIITIVVLLILAVVAINAIRGDGIINYAKNAANDYNSAQQEEQDTIQSYLDILGNVGTNQGTSETISQLKVGEYVNYTPDSNISEVTINGLYNSNNLEEGKNYIEYSSGAYDSEALEHNHPTPADDESDYINQTITRQSTNWQVLKNDGKNIYLISETPISSVILGAMPGYLNGENILNNVCNKLYGGSKGIARSINVEDINSIFRPNFNANLETNWTYKDATTKLEVPLTSGNRTIADLNLNFHQYVTLTTEQLAWDANYYCFDPGMTKKDSNGNPLYITAEEAATYTAMDAYDLVFNAFDDASSKYWVASTCIHVAKNVTADDGTVVDEADFGLRYIKNGYMSQEYLTNGGDCAGIGHEFEDCGMYKELYYRPIVVLNSNLEFEAAAQTNGVNTWNIK